MPSGLSWSSSRGPSSAIFPGTLLKALIVVDRVPLVDLLVPGLSRTLGNGDG